MMQPRWYQTEAVEAVASWMATASGNPAIILPTGAGKSLVIAMLADRIIAQGGRVAIFQHREELIRQNAEKFVTLRPDVPIGIWSASLKQKNAQPSVVFAGIQSAYREDVLLNFGWRDLIIGDECHLVPADGDGMWRQMLGYFAKMNPESRFVGLTASPWRLDSGSIIGPDKMLHDVAFQAPLVRLIEEGYLCNLISKDPDFHVSTDGVGKVGGEWNLKQLDAEASKDERLVRQAVAELLQRTSGRHSCLVFCCGRKHGQMVASMIAEAQPGNVAYVDGATPKGERAAILEGFAAMQFGYLVNIDVLTTGFDAPCIDSIALLRPSESKGLVYQMIGRGLRKHESKDDCLVLDFAGNLLRHGPINTFADDDGRDKTKREGTGEAPGKPCPECKEIVPASASRCFACGHEFPPREIRHGTRPTEAPVIGPDGSRMVVVNVREMRVSVYAPEHKPRMIRITYSLEDHPGVTEYVCLEHPAGSYQRRQAEAWWRDRCSTPIPPHCWAAYRLWKACPEAFGIPQQLELKFQKGKKWPDIVRSIGIQKCIFEDGYLADLMDDITIDSDIFQSLRRAK